MAKPSTELEPLTAEQAGEVTRLNRFNDDDLRGITSYEEAEALLQSEFGESAVDIADLLGNGFGILPTDDKTRLIGEPFLVLDWIFNIGDNGEFVSARVVTQKGSKLVVNDGSVGIRDQLRDVTDRTRRSTGLRVPRGLRVSQYDTCSECDRPRRKDDAVCPNMLSNGTVCGDESDKRNRGQTFYLDTSA